MLEHPSTIPCRRREASAWRRPSRREVHAARRSSPFARPPSQTTDAVARLCAALGCALQPAKQELLGGHYRTRALACQTAIAAFAIVPLAYRRREMGSGERDLGARVLPLSPGRHFIQQEDDRSRPLDRTAQICLASGRHRSNRLCCAQWAAEVHRTIPAYVLWSAARLAGRRIDSARRRWPAQVWAVLGRPGPKVNLIKQYGSDFLN